MSAQRDRAPLLVPVWLERLSSWAKGLLLIGAVFALAGWFVYWRTRARLEGDEVSREKIRSRVEGRLMGEPFDLTRGQIDDAEESVRSWVSTGVSSLGVEQATLAVQILGGAILTLVLTFFLVKDGPGMWNAVVSRVNPVRADAV